MRTEFESLVLRTAQRVAIHMCFPRLRNEIGCARTQCLFFQVFNFHCGSGPAESRVRDNLRLGHTVLQWSTALSA